MSIIYSILFKFITIDNISQLLAKCIAYVLGYASKNGGKAWDRAKDIILKVNIWTSLFMQVYDDDTLTQEEEQMIADAIKAQTKARKVNRALKAMSK